jgi:hypothetical protein
MRRLRQLLSVTYVLLLGACLVAVVLTVVALGSSGATVTAPYGIPRTSPSPTPST